MLLIEATFNTPFGVLKVAHDNHHLYLAKFEAPSTKASPLPSSSSPFCNKIAQALDTYFENPKYRFQIPLAPKGSSFQQQVWQALLALPSGRTLTYGTLALQLQTSPRAIGQACKKNPIALFIPCHRIVGQINLGGYMGKHPDSCSIKKQLLDHESQAVHN